jgi:hypothetical protein
MGQREKITPMASSLASDEASLATRAPFMIDGGRTAM